MSTTVAAPAMDVTVSSLVRRPVADVARHAADPATAEAWLPHVLGRKLPLGFDLVSFEPTHGMVLRSEQGPVALEATYTWEPTGAWTKLTLRQTGEAPLVGLAAPLIEKAAAKAMARTVARLVETLEVRQAASA
ncbi:hypothetical protein [Nocardioides jiangxiensis]|uniref:Polyketide cyclase / dehydrase and lipid transport n=1 Tax=Nocardioides jiangxiensis TaxID=3064524 RepID=A0ABT9B3D8_9ACTN|nr:hypothetical protein [Nocardioides sp. WY-20]MDO7868127.1 hypothetical protein [Nocardioides sp. WY-20]